ncbi:hypothetical protein EG028_02895 [Chitinophaga barathri]|uniref:Uncharacterized protein n=1 Tax=Chitinophaga barathri TaxID=1647451 RepID=A0A3N4MSY4_9BACT|nr:hypothetical protein EG028_02895 [Chitinophaga barathri]
MHNPQNNISGPGSSIKKQIRIQSVKYQVCLGKFLTLNFFIKSCARCPERQPPSSFYKKIQG